jgi:outer membrane cobalamin receptor
MRRVVLCGVVWLCVGQRVLVAQSQPPGATAVPRADTLITGTLLGEVVDGSTGAAVPLAQVTLQGLSRSVTSDLRGRFRFTRLSAGLYAIGVRRIGYEPTVQRGARVGSDSVNFVRITLVPTAFRLAAITVAPGSFAFADVAPVARQTITRADIQNAPFGEDLFRAMNRLPGLSSGDYGAGFSIRGGRQDETLILLDGLEVYEPFHLKDFNEGALSIFNVEAIDGVELLTGGFSAHYGDKRSGVMSIASRVPTGPGARASVGASVSGAQALAEGTFGDGRGSWLMSGRTGFVGAILGLINKSETRAPTYQDVFGSLRYALHPNHTLALNVLQAGDRYRFEINGTTGFNDSIKTRERANNTYGNQYAWLTLKSLLGRSVSLKTLASVGSVTATRGGNELRTASGVVLYDVAGSRSFSLSGVKQDYSFQPSERAILDWGFDFRSMRARYDWTNTNTQNPDDPTPDTTGFYPKVTRRTRRANGQTIAAYVSNRLQLAPPLTLELGLRYDAATYSHDHDWSPRVHALLQLGETTTLRGGWGQYRQRQGIADENAFDKLNQYFRSESSKQWTIGLEHRYAGGGSFRIEGYTKAGNRLRPILRNWKSGLNVFPESSEDRILVYPDEQASKGIEVYHDRRLGSRTNLRLGYAYAIAYEHVNRIVQVNDPLIPAFAPTHPNPQDQRHAVNLDLTYRPAPAWIINTSLTYHSGWPYTNEQGVPVRRRNGTLDLAVRPDTLYGARLPSYQRVDLRVTR